MKKAAKKPTKAAAAPEIDPSFAPVAKAFARDSHVTSGVMMSSFGLKVNGKIFAMFARGQFVAKLPKARVDDLVASGKGERFDPGHRRLMKEWIAMDSGQATWVALAKEAYAFVKSAEHCASPGWWEARGMTRSRQEVG